MFNKHRQQSELSSNDVSDEVKPVLNDKVGVESKNQDMLVNLRVKRLSILLSTKPNRNQSIKILCFKRANIGKRIAINLPLEFHGEVQKNCNPFIEEWEANILCNIQVILLKLHNYITI